MKKLHLLFVLLFFSLIKVFPQSIPNSNFEQWTLQTMFEQPEHYLTSNPQMLMMGLLPNCTKETDCFSGQYAVKIETVTNGQDTINGILLIGMPGNQTIDGGYPFAARPDTLIVHLKYNILPDDTAHLIFFFKNSGAIMGTTGINLLGQQLNYASFKLPVNWIMPGNADSVAVLISSSNLDSPGVPGSYIYIDDIQLTGSVIPFPNGGFENWIAENSEEPDHWKTLNYAKTTIPSVTKVTDNYNGTYALKLETIETIWGQTLGYITNGYIGNNGPEGGVPVNNNPAQLTGYYKYLPNGPDTAVAIAFTSRYDALLDSTIILEMIAIKLIPTPVYAPFEINLNYNSFPFADTINVSFASSNLLDSGAYIGLGSILFIDSLNINYLPLFINNISQENEFEFYPNPAHDFLILKSKNNLMNSEILIYNSLGQVVLSKLVKEKIDEIYMDVSKLLNGTYFIEVRSSDRLGFRNKLVIKNS